MLQIGIKTQIDPKSIIGVSAAILGTTGTGKTNTAIILIEELVKASIPVTILDLEGEYSEYFKDNKQFKVFNLDESWFVDKDKFIAHAKHIASTSIERRVSVILDFGDLDLSAELSDFLLMYLSELFRVAKIIKKPYSIIAEEIHEYCGQGEKTKLSKMLAIIAKRGRKRGLSLIMISQRAASIDKNVLSQARLLLLHKIILSNDRSTYRNMLGLSLKECNDLIDGLSIGKCIVFNDNLVYTDDIRQTTKPINQINF